MSGWIKFTKSLRTHPRTLRIARALVTQERYTCNAAVTLVCGALVQLWCYMDDHGREDDTLDLSPEEIDELVGVPGFSRLLPEDWLEVLEDGRTKLPDFQQHNGVEARKKALTAQRVAKHRATTAKAPVTQERYASVTGALPDQTRPDQTKTTPREEARPQPAAPSPAPKPVTTIGLPPGVNADALDKWEQWLLIRGKPVNELSRPAIARKLVAMGTAEQQAEAVEHSIAGQYQQLYAPKAQANGSGPAAKPFKRKSADELEAELRAKGVDPYAA